MTNVAVKTGTNDLLRSSWHSIMALDWNWNTIFKSLLPFHFEVSSYRNSRALWWFLVPSTGILLRSITKELWCRFGIVPNRQTPFISRGACLFLKPRLQAEIDPWLIWSLGVRSRLLWRIGILGIVRSSSGTMLPTHLLQSSMVRLQHLRRLEICAE